MGFVDLHSHYLPGIDDGVRTMEEGIELVRRLHAVGFETIMATPHIRTAMFENRKPGVEKAHAEFVEAFARETSGSESVPALGLGAEHYFDDMFWGLFKAGNSVPYPGGKAALVELPRERVPLRLANSFFEMQVKGIKPVLAHPERYRPFFKKSDEMEPLVSAGALPLLDIMSLTGKYGRHPRKAAERMLDEGYYYAACSDAHRPADADIVRKGIVKLRKRVGDEEAERLLSENPKRILAGTAEFG